MNGCLTNAQQNIRLTINVTMNLYLQVWALMKKLNRVYMKVKSIRIGNTTRYCPMSGLKNTIIVCMKSCIILENLCRTDKMNANYNNVKLKNN